MKKAIVPGLLILVCSLALVGGVLASNGVAIERSVLGSGGEQVTDGSLYILNGTLGEPIASDLDLGTSYGLSSGFWWPPEFKVYLPLVLRGYS
jgi:hypothetical protein